MKKIFTLIAVATMALSANAQEIFKVSTKPVDGSTINATTSVKLTYGNDGAWADPASKEDKLGNGFNNFTSGGQNPKDGELSGGKSTGNGYKQETKNLPKSGTYYVFECSKSGYLTIYVQLNGDKNFFVIDGADGTNLTTSLDITFNQLSGKDITPTLDETTGSYTTGEKLKGGITFPVAANSKYYVLCTGSKLGFYGFELSDSKPTGIEAVKGVKAAFKGATYNVAGQQVDAAFKGLVIKDGKKIINK